MTLLEMDAKFAIKNESGSQRLESPLDVLSRAASMIQKESNITDVSKQDNGHKEDVNTDGITGDNQKSPPHSTSYSPALNISSKITVHKEKRDRRINDRKHSNSGYNVSIKEAVRTETRLEDDRVRHPDLSFTKMCKADCTSCNGAVQSPSEADRSYHHKNALINLHYRDRMKQEVNDHKEEKCYQIDEEQDHRSFRYPRIPPPPLIALHPHPFSWIPPPYPSPLSLVRRQSVITSATCPQQYPTDRMPLCPCIDPKCNLQKYPFAGHLKSPSGVKREVFSAVPPGFELPTVEEHFRKSLGKDYDDVPVNVDSLNSVDEHFAKALGKTWYSIRYQKCMESPFRTRERVLSGCNL